tara:strand:+ start:106 stop:759 length:654 start_codon:yes stop_codon:yes gene_type:complete
MMIDFEKFFILKNIGLQPLWIKKNNFSQFRKSSLNIDSKEKKNFSNNFYNSKNFFLTYTNCVINNNKTIQNYFFLLDYVSLDENEKLNSFQKQLLNLYKNILFSLNLNLKEYFKIEILKQNNSSEINKLDFKIFDFLDIKTNEFNPEIIISFGESFKDYLFSKAPRKIKKIDHNLFTYNDIPLLVTYSLPYLLSNPGEKYKSWVDLCKAKKIINEYK